MKFLITALLCLVLFLPACNSTSQDALMNPIGAGKNTYTNMYFAKKYRPVAFASTTGSYMASGPSGTVGVAPFELTDGSLDVDGIHIPDGITVFQPGYSQVAEAYSNVPGDIPSINVGNAHVTWNTASVQVLSTGKFYFDPITVNFNGEVRSFTNATHNVVPWVKNGDTLLVNVDNDTSAVVLSLLTSNGETRNVAGINK